MKRKILLLCLVAMMLFVTGCDKGGGEATGGNDLYKENEKLTVLIDLFGQETPVEVDLIQITKN